MEYASYGAFERMLSIISEIKYFSQLDQHVALKAFGEYFKSIAEADKIENVSNYEAYEGLLALKKLFADAKDDVNRRIDPNKSKLICETIDRVSRIAEYGNMTQNWPMIRSLISDADIHGLKIAQDTLPPSKKEQVIRREELSSWVDKLMKLQDEINESELDQESKDVFLKSINQTITAINLYRINGVNELDNALLITIGNMTREKRKNQNSSTWIEKIIPIVGQIAQAIQTASAVTALIEYFGK